MTPKESAKRIEFEECATKMWRSKQSAESCYAEQRVFMDQYPQICRTWANIDAIARELRYQNVAPDYQHLVAVMCQLAASGELVISPAAVGLAEDRITGEALKNYSDLKQLLRPAVRD